MCSLSKGSIVMELNEAVRFSAPVLKKKKKEKKENNIIAVVE